METNKIQRDVKIICEIHPQHYGSMSEIKRMVIQSKIGGADIVKLQLYDSKKLWGNEERTYLDISENELSEINDFCKIQGIELSASIFDLKRVDWCEKLDFKTYKIASRSVSDKELCEKIISLNKKTIISLGMYDYEKEELPFEKNPNIDYLYCISKYPTSLEEIKMPNFDKSFFSGFSDHTVGISACLFALANGAKIIEKHFSNSKSMGVSTQSAHVCSMNIHDLEKIREYSDTFNLLRKSRA